MGRCRWETESWGRMEFNKVTFGAKGKHERKLFVFFFISFNPPPLSLLRMFHLYNAFWLVSLEIDTFSHENLLIPSMSDEKYLFENFSSHTRFQHCTAETFDWCSISKVYNARHIDVSWNLQKSFLEKSLHKFNASSTQCRQAQSDKLFSKFSHSHVTLDFIPLRVFVISETLNFYLCAFSSSTAVCVL